MAAAGVASALTMPSPYAGELPKFSCESGFMAGDFPALRRVVGTREPLDDQTATHFRREYSGNSSQAVVESRLRVLTVHNDELADAECRLVVPVEIFTVVILCAAVFTYTSSPPHGQAGKVDVDAVLTDIGRDVFAGGRVFGAIRRSHVEAVLVSDVPDVNADGRAMRHHDDVDVARAPSARAALRVECGAARWHGPLPRAPAAPVDAVGDALDPYRRERGARRQLPRLLHSPARRRRRRRRRLRRQSSGA